jgi:hypothetical protein
MEWVPSFQFRVYINVEARFSEGPIAIRNRFVLEWCKNQFC